MDRIALVPNTARDAEYKYTKEFMNIIGSRAEILLAETHRAAGGNARYVCEDALFSYADVAVALGGDGTILAAAGEVSRYNVPVLGINLGHLGFLAEVEPQYMEFAAECLLAGKYRIEERVMLQADVMRDGKCMETFHALNDIVVSRASFSRLLGLRTTVDTHTLDSFVADGVILSTPTGSTAYSLSAGGPILDPSLDVILVTPVCPHTMHTRPMVLPLAHGVAVELESGRDYGEAFVSADGRHGSALQPGDVVRASRSQYTTKLIKISNKTFYDTIRQKLNERGAGK